MKCRDCRYIDHFLIEDKYWCYKKQTYVDPEQPPCEKFEPYLRKPAGNTSESKPWSWMV